MEPRPVAVTRGRLRVLDERREQGIDFDDLPSVVGSVRARSALAVCLTSRRGSRRYEYLGFDDVGPKTEMESVRPRRRHTSTGGQAVTLGGSWRVMPWVRVMANAGVEWFSDPLSAQNLTPGGYLTLGTRLQIELQRRFALPACAVCALYLSWLGPLVLLAQRRPRTDGLTEARHGAGVRPGLRHDCLLAPGSMRFASRSRRSVSATCRRSSGVTPPMPGGRRVRTRA